MSNNSGYNTFDGPIPSPGSNHENGSTDEDSALLPKRSGSSRSWRLCDGLMADINPSWADGVLIVCFLVTGLVDSSAIYRWQAFVSMQTGNTVYVGLGVFQKTESVRWIKSLISILSFCIGSLFFSSFHRYFSPRRRWVFLASFALQALLIAAAAVLVTVAAADPEPVIWQNVLPIVMLSFQSSGQAVASRVLQYNELPTVVLTSTYCDLMSDPQLFTARLPDNSKRNRRVAAVVMAVGGAILGGFFARTWTGIAGGLWVAAGLKGAVALVWSVWIAEAVSGEEEE